ncbi:MAG: transcription antitermination factor NusB [Spirochaetaceae bacterium]|jgi:N utilization substance protein B|nr:transcription antitermination factor NusB [Spirochaetaceae bacterium]
MASRRRGRILAFQALYSWEASRNPGDPPAPLVPETIFDFSWLESEKRDALDDGTRDFSRLLITGTIENIKAVDKMIKAHLKNWDFSRLNRVDLALLRLSAYTLLFQTDMPPSIVIDEAINISKEFGTDDSFRFINGVLDSIRKTIQDEQNSESGEPP